MTRIDVLAPMSGSVVPIEEVPDPVFAERMLGDGVAVDPVEGVGVAPVSGRLVVFHSAGHAFAVEEATTGVAVLVHIGLDTVEMHGEGFERLAEAGQDVRAGQEIVRFDLAAIEAAGHAARSPIVLPQLEPSARVTVTGADRVQAGRVVILTVELPDGERAPGA